MKTIIAGSRGITDFQIVKDAVCAAPWTVSEVISGGARGVDKLGEMWARESNVPYVRYPANWGKHGVSAGYRRNEEMAEFAEALIAVWDGASKGTKHMIDIAIKKKLVVFVVNLQSIAKG